MLTESELDTHLNEIEAGREIYRRVMTYLTDQLIEARLDSHPAEHDYLCFAELLAELLSAACETSEFQLRQNGFDQTAWPDDWEAIAKAERERLVDSRRVQRPDYGHELLSVLNTVTSYRAGFATGNGACQVIQQSSKKGAE